MSANRHVLALAASALAIASGRDARAEDVLSTAFLSPGVVWSWAEGRLPAHGTGFEISAGAWFRGPPAPSMMTLTTNTLMLGAVFRTQGYDGPGGNYARRTIAAEVGYSFVGVEIGYAARQATAEGGAIAGAHIGPYFSIGPIYVGTQYLVPAGGANGPVGYEINFALKLPLTPLLLMAGMGGMTPGGRPCVVAGEARTAQLARRCDWV